MRLTGRIRLVIAALCFITTMNPCRAWGQAPPATETPDRLSLGGAIERAWTGNADIEAIAHEIDAARGRVLVAEGREPTEFFLALDEIHGGHLSEAGETTLGIGQAFPFPGKRGIRGDLARIDVRLLETEERRIRRRLTAVVTEAYFLAKFLEGRTLNLETSESLLSTFMETTSTRFEAGQAPYLDVLRAKVELSRIRNDLLESRRESREAVARLNLLLGRPGSAPVELVTELAGHREDPGREASLEGAISGSAALEKGRLELESARLAKRLAGKSRLPDIRLEVSAQRLQGGGSTINLWGTGIDFAMPLLSKTPRGLAAESEADLARREALLAAREREVRTAAETAWEVVATSREQLRLFETSILDDLESALRTGIDAYRTGRVDALGLIDIYRTYIESRTEYDRSLYFHLSAIARLEVAGDLE